MFLQLTFTNSRGWMVTEEKMEPSAFWFVWFSRGIFYESPD
jgi:hypothetical protein